MSRLPPPLETSKPASPAWFLLFPALIFLYVFLLFWVMMFVTMEMEQNDAFCASCHTEPEHTFFGRTQGETTVDLATFHKTQGILCIDCHSGPGSQSRIRATLGGAKNILAQLTGRAHQPSRLPAPMPDENCLKCHAGVTSEPFFERHFHNYLALWQAKSSTAGRCSQCHTAHTLEGDASKGYIQMEQVDQLCDQCHTALEVKQ